MFLYGRNVLKLGYTNHEKQEHETEPKTDLTHIWEYAILIS